MQSFLKRILSLSACAVIVFSAASCGEKANTDNTTTTAANGEATTTATAATTLDPAHTPLELPVVDLGGFEFNVASQTATDTYRQFDSEEETGEPMNDALYKRNSTIEDRYNVSIKQTLIGDITANVSKAILAGDDAYTIVVGSLNNGGNSIHSLANSHLLLDYNDVPYLQESIEKAWWDQNLRENLAINNKLYYNTGDIVLYDDMRIAIMYFNKGMFAKEGLDYPYKYVLDGTWTIDKLVELTRGINKDINGDGKMDQYDQWGLMSQYENGLHMFHAAGEKIAGLDKDGVPTLTFNSPRALEVIGKVLGVSIDGETMYHADGITGLSAGSTSVWTEASLYFQDDRFLMRTSVFEPIVRDLRAMPTDFGILPYVKYDEKQENYYSHVEVGGYVVGIPMTSDPEKTGLILEALAYESMSTITPAFYELSLNSKVLRDNESEAMLDIIFKSKHYDLGYLFNIGGYASVPRTLVQSKSTDFVSRFDALETAAQTALKKLADEY